MGGSTKQALLQALSAAEGAYISGQQLAEALGVSRAAVHKAAQALSAQGYALDSAPRRGYRLAGGDPFCAEAVGPYPAPVHIYDTLQSSNLTAKQLGTGRCTPRHAGAHGPPAGGARARPGGGLKALPGRGVYLSLILRPALSAADAQSATISAAVAVARAVKALCGLELGIKWVNDLYDQGRKVCGILTEAGTDMESGQLEWLVVGIGLNLTTSPADWPEELARTAGSLYPGGPAPVSRAVLAGAIARELLLPLPGLRLSGPSTGPAVLCRATGSPSAPGPRPMPQRPFPLTMRAVWWWSARAAGRLPCSTARSASGRQGQGE